MVAVGRRWLYDGDVGKPSTGVLAMTIARSAAEVLSGHVALDLECMGRLYVNADVRRLWPPGFAPFRFLVPNGSQRHCAGSPIRWGKAPVRLTNRRGLRRRRALSKSRCRSIRLPLRRSFEDAPRATLRSLSLGHSSDNGRLRLHLAASRSFDMERNRYRASHRPYLQTSGHGTLRQPAMR